MHKHLIIIERLNSIDVYLSPYKNAAQVITAIKIKGHAQFEHDLKPLKKSDEAKEKILAGIGELSNYEPIKTAKQTTYYYV